jgi:hypothetical protein
VCFLFVLQLASFTVFCCVNSWERVERGRQTALASGILLPSYLSYFEMTAVYSRSPRCLNRMLDFLCVLA